MSKDKPNPMTEEDLRALPRFVGLPVFHEDDEEAHSITRLQPKEHYNSIREATTLQEVNDLLNDDRYEPLGGVRYEEGGKVAVYAYFGEKRP